MAKVDLPSVEELRRLPLRAIVAYAVRCALRVRPLYKSDNEGHVRAVDRALSRAAAFAEADAAAHERAPLANAYADAAADANAYAAANAAYVAHAHAYAADATDAHAHYVAAHDAADSAAHAAAAHAAHAADAHAAHAAAVTAARADYEGLASSCRQSSPELGDPIDPSEDGPLGPLWPEGEPEWFGRGKETVQRILQDSVGISDKVNVETKKPEEKQTAPGRARMSAYIGEFAPEEEVAEKLADFCRALSAYHIACGGSGLVIDEWDIFVPEPEPVEVV